MAEIDVFVLDSVNNTHGARLGYAFGHHPFDHLSLKGGKVIETSVGAGFVGPVVLGSVVVDGGSAAVGCDLVACGRIFVAQVVGLEYFADIEAGGVVGVVVAGSFVGGEAKCFKRGCAAAVGSAA